MMNGIFVFKGNHQMMIFPTSKLGKVYLSNIALSKPKFVNEFSKKVSKCNEFVILFPYMASLSIFGNRIFS